MKRGLTLEGMGIDISDMSPLNGKVIIKADPEKYHTKKFNEGTIWIDPAFNPDSDELVTQDGTVVQVPELAIDKWGNHIDTPIEIKKGDHVYCHHWLCHEENKIVVSEDEFFFIVDYFSVYFVKEAEGSYRMLGEQNLVEPIIEDEKNFKTKSGLYTKPTIDKQKCEGVLVAINDKMREMGAKEGDLVMFTSVADYPIMVDGKLYYRMLNEDILAIIDEKEVKLWSEKETA